MSLNKQVKKNLLLIGLTTVTLLLIALFIVVGIYANFLKIDLVSLVPVLLIFAPGVYISFYFCYKTKLLEVE